MGKTKMKKYAQYKTSRIPWMDSLPEHWSVKRAKFIYKKESRPIRDTDGVVTCFRDGVVTLRAKRRTTGFTESIQECGYQGIRKGDLVIHVMDAFAGAIGVSDSDGKGTPVYNVCTAIDNVNNYYYAHVLRIMARTGFIQSLYRGIRERSSDFRFDVFAMQYLPLPPRSEQDQIVRYLDWQVSKINKLIAAKKKEIQLLKERMLKQFEIISGKSGKKVRLRRVLSLLNDRVEILPDEYYQKTGMYNRGRGIFQRAPLRGKDMGDSTFQKIQQNCIMISGQFAWEGAAYITLPKDETGVVSHRYYLLRPQIPSITTEYVWAFLMSEYGLMIMKQCSHGSAGRNRPLNINELLNKYIPLPVENEDLQTITNAVRILIHFQESCQSKIDIWNELRTRLISDVVTGQIDVHDVEVPDFEMVEEEVAETDEADEEFDENMEDITNKEED